MTNLNQQTKEFSFVLNLPNCEKYDLKYLLTKVEEYVRSNSEEYYYIVHDKDVLEDGTLKTIHIHLLYRTNSKNVIRLKTELHRLTEFIYGNDTDKLLCTISIDKWRNHDYGIQYLTHRNDVGKHQYSIEEVFTNDIEYLTDVMNMEVDSKTLDVESIYNLCIQCNSRIELYTRIGLTNCRNYRNIINDIWEDVKLQRHLCNNKEKTNILLSLLEQFNKERKD